MAISSDDLFMLDHPPKKTLLVGGSFIALECAGFLHNLGFDVTVMVRSILLRGFDQECANKIGDFMEKDGVKFIRNMVPAELKRQLAPLHRKLDQLQAENRMLRAELEQLKKEKTDEN